jgi:catechol 2,3-dioxygenase-like lactoylglutathione lyase family enzyme
MAPTQHRVNHKETRMNIIGPDALVFGVEDLPACRQYLLDYGLKDAGNDRFEALDGTAIVLRAKDDATLPPPWVPPACCAKPSMAWPMPPRWMPSKPNCAATAKSAAAMAWCAAWTTWALHWPSRSPCAARWTAFGTRQRSRRCPAHRTSWACRRRPALPRTLSHVVYFVPDAAKAEAFYQRLGFVCTDRFTGVGPFLRPAGTLDHHTLFMIQTPPFMKGCEHFTFHMGGPTEVLLAGTRFVEKGYQSFWGPGRHRFGSNWFWYFNSPLGCHVEYDADMDLHDDQWAAREAPMGADASQLFLFQYREKWAPSGPPPPGAAH